MFSIEVHTCCFLRPYRHSRRILSWNGYSFIEIQYDIFAIDVFQESAHGEKSWIVERSGRRKNRRIGYRIELKEVRFRA